MGRSGSFWEFAPLAIAALRMHPEDVEVRFLFAAGFAAAGLRECALEQIERLPDGVQNDPGVRALVQATEQLPPGRVSIEVLERTVRINLATLATRGEPCEALECAIARWCETLALREWFRTGSGEVVWRSAAAADGWGRLSVQRAQVDAIRLPHDDSPTAAEYPMWYAIEGIDPPWMLRRVWRSTRNRSDGFAPMMLVVQRDATQALDGLAQMDLSDVLGDAGVRVFVGEDAGELVGAFLGNRAAVGVRIACAAIGLPTTGARIQPTVSEHVERATNAARNIERETVTHLAMRPRPRTRIEWAARFAAACSGNGKPLRVLVSTSRFSTFLRHSAVDLADALRQMGCEALVHMETDTHSLLEPLGTLRACDEFDPDLIVIPNYTRRHVAGRVLEDVPFVAWVQDAMPHLFEKGIGARLGELDFVAGNLSEEMFQHFGYARARALHVPMAASARKFHPGPIAALARSKHECEIAYVSHHSETPARLHDRKRAEAGSAAASLLDALYARVIQEIDAPIDSGPLTLRLRALAREELGRASLASDEPSMARVLSAYVFPLADRSLRHRTLEWAAAVAVSREWRLHLYGKGWESHPTLGQYARGELPHGDDLRACYQSARAHLHVSLHTAVHQRVFECAMSGGLPVCRLQADDLSQLEYLAAARACRGREPDVIDPDRRSADGYAYGGYEVESCEAGRAYAMFLRALGLPVPRYAWLNQIHAERLRSSSQERIDGEGRSLWDLWPDPAAVMFHDRTGLERVLVRAVGDEAWRDAQSHSLGDSARRRVSYDTFVRRLVEFVADGLAGESNEPARWYDNRPSSAWRRNGAGSGA